MKQHPPESLRAFPPLSASPGRGTQPARRGGPCAAARAWGVPVSCAVFLAVLLAALLAACGSRPPVPDWQMNAHGAAEPAPAAYLAGEDRVAQQEWARARAEVARTGRPQLLARVERGEEIIITRHGHAVARLVPTADFDREAVQAAIDQIKELRSQQTLGDVDLKELVNAGRRY